MENQNNFTDLEQPTPILEETPTPKSSSVGALIGIVVVILVIVLGGLYFWGQRVEQLEQKDSLTALGEDNSVETLQTQGTSDEIGDIEADVNATDLENLDKEVGTIDAELNAEGL